jgi:hypothetical protein
MVSNIVLLIYTWAIILWLLRDVRTWSTFPHAVRFGGQTLELQSRHSHERAYGHAYHHRIVVNAPTTLWNYEPEHLRAIGIIRTLED